jgi:hypothetical protein
VEDPSKFHFGRLSTDDALSTGKDLAFDRRFPTASTQTYSAITILEGKAIASYLEIIEGSRDD